RVLDRFLEAVVDIAQADGAVLGLLDDDETVKVLVGTGTGSALSGHHVPMAGSAMGRVIRTGVALMIADVRTTKEDLHLETYERVKDSLVALAVVPVSRRGERIGA